MSRTVVSTTSKHGLLHQMWSTRMIVSLARQLSESIVTHAHPGRASSSQGSTDIVVPTDHLEDDGSRGRRSKKSVNYKEPSLTK